MITIDTLHARLKARVLAKSRQFKHMLQLICNAYTYEWKLTISRKYLIQVIRIQFESDMSGSSMDPDPAR